MLTYLLLILSGMAAGFAFPPSKFGVLAFVAFVPLLIVLENRMGQKKNTRLLYTFFFFFHGAANWWVLSWQKETDPYLMMAGAGLWLGHPFFLMPAFWIYRFIRRRTSLKIALLSLPFSWTAVEWLHSLSDLSYPWLAIGYTQTYHTILIQFADISGVWGVSTLIMGINCLIAHYFIRRNTMSLTTSSLSQYDSRQSNRTLVRHALVCVVLLLVPLVYGTVRISQVENWSITAQSKTPPVFGIVQPSINPWKKWRGGIMEMVDLHRHLQDSLNAVQHCDVTVWSETAIPLGLRMQQNEALFSPLRTWVDTSGTALMTGFADYEYFPAGAAPANAQDFPNDPTMKFKVYNSAGVMSPNIANIPTHHKSKLTPFGEYMPLSDDFPVIQTWLKWGVGISGWNKGAGATAVPAIKNGDTIARIGPVICIESIYPNYVADYVRRGADVLAVITNDAWYDGTFGPEQHYCISRMRAVETRRSVVRCGNSGVSGFISAIGTSIQAPPRERLAISGTVPLHNRTSTYVLLGDWWAWFSCGVSLFVALQCYISRRRTAKEAKA